FLSALFLLQSHKKFYFLFPCHFLKQVVCLIHFHLSNLPFVYYLSHASSSLDFRDDHQKISSFEMDSCYSNSYHTPPKAKLRLNLAVLKLIVSLLTFLCPIFPNTKIILCRK